MSRATFRPSAPVVINLIALSIVLGGQAVALPASDAVRKGDIAAFAVTARTFGKGVVTTEKLRRAAIDEHALGKSSIVGRTIKPGGVDGVSLAGLVPSSGQIPDADPAGPMGADGNWTPSGASISCPPGAQLISGGLARGGQLNGQNGRAFIQSMYPSATDPATWIGQISTDTGGTSGGNVVALCLGN